MTHVADNLQLPLLLLATLSPILLTSGYDAYTACAKPFRTSKFYAEPPCDFRYQSWCTIPGSAYPWQAVRRFVRENQGLMRRMYGDERHISVMRAEIQSNDVEYLTESEWKLREQVRLRYSSRIPQKVSVEAMSKEPTSSSTSESHPQTTSPPATSPNTSFITSYSTASHSIVSESSEEEQSTTPSEQTLNTTFMTTNQPVSTTQFETTATEVDSNSTEQLDTETTDESTEQEQVTEEMTTVKENELFQDDTETVQVAEKSPPLVKLKGVNACPVKEEVVAPFWANNTRGEVLALLNVYPFEQYVHWEKCTYENKQMFCRDGCRCEQQYRLHRLLAYDPSNECRGIFSDWFKFPSCCVCRCYDLPIAFHITSRSPRTNSINNNNPPYWYRDKLKSNT